MQFYRIVTTVEGKMILNDNQKIYTKKNNKIIK